METPFSSSCPNNCEGDFECSVCFQRPVKPVATPCGHLFCWPCLYQWLMHHSTGDDCPICKSSLSVENLIPIYKRDHAPSDSEAESTLDNKIPSRSSMHNIQKGWYLTDLFEKTVEANLFIYFALFLLVECLIWTLSSSTQEGGEFKLGWVDILMLLALAVAFFFRMCFWVVDVVYNLLTENVYVGE